jgi:hypothetical protein
MTVCIVSDGGFAKTSFIVEATSFSFQRIKVGLEVQKFTPS